MICFMGIFSILCILLSIISVTDIQSFRISNFCCIILACLGILYSVVFKQSWIDCVIGFLSISFPLTMMCLLTHEKWIGGGDIKLLAASGILLGWKKNLLAFYIAGICVLINTMVNYRAYKPGKKIALGPYLSIGILVSFLFGDMIKLI